MKHCNVCDKSLPLEAFGKNKARYDGLQSRCKSCRREYQNAWFQDNKELQSQRIKKNRDAKKKILSDYIWSLLSTTPCMDCGEANPLVLEFDHRDPAMKEYKIAACRGAKTIGLDTLKQEIAKCDIICANCHRIRTQNMFGSWRLDFVVQEGPSPFS